jgi:hypothetical protein
MAGRSGLTAISRRAPSAPVRWLESEGLIYPGADMLDYGCGKGADAEYLGIDGYDPNHRPDTAPLARAYDTVLCTFVANVLDRAERDELLRCLKSLLRRHGVAYVAVRRDVPKGAHVTSRGTYQERVYLTEEWPDTRLIHSKGGAFAIYELGGRHHG